MGVVIFCMLTNKSYLTLLKSQRVQYRKARAVVDAYLTDERYTKMYFYYLLHVLIFPSEGEGSEKILIKQSLIGLLNYFSPTEPVGCPATDMGSGLGR